MRWCLADVFHVVNASPVTQPTLSEYRGNLKQWHELQNITHPSWPTQDLGRGVGSNIYSTIKGKDCLSDRHSLSINWCQLSAVSLVQPCANNATERPNLCTVFTAYTWHKTAGVYASALHTTLVLRQLYGPEISKNSISQFSCSIIN